MDRLVVLGGSSPFTAGLIDALEHAGASLAPCELVLHGRQTVVLERIALYARFRLAAQGWCVRTETTLQEALAGATFVVHQIRYGGMDGRAEDEALALRYGIHPDESLGPAALNAILRIAAGLAGTAATLATTCPDAWVFNLTNPLSLTTALMVQAGVGRCVGLCELPRVTAKRAAAEVRAPFEEVSWTYQGLNHRGFIVELSRGGTNLIPELTQRLGRGVFEGILATEIARLEAIPTKYFRLVRKGARPEDGRAAFLARLRERIDEELMEQPDRRPPSLCERYMDWYPESVVPMLVALASDDESVQIVNLESADGTVREVHAVVSRDSIAPCAPPAPRGEIALWLSRFERNEVKRLAAARSPSLASIQEALETDPLVPDDLMEPIADALWTNVRARPQWTENPRG